MNILVTGGAGFIGSHIVDVLLDRGHRVFVIDNLSTGRRELINPKAIFIQADICDSDKLEQIVQENKINRISHHAAQLDVGISVKNPLFDAKVNILGTINIFEVAQKYGVEKVVFASSAAVYGDVKEIPTSENCVFSPISPYGIAKLTMEKYAYFYKLTYGTQYTALRYSNVYGPRQTSHGEAGVIAKFFDKMIKGESVTIFGQGNSTRDYVFVGDVVRANVLALENDLSGSYNISTNRSTGILELFEGMAKLSGYTQNPLFTTLRNGEIMHSKLDNTLFGKMTGWEPQVSLAEGLQKTVEYFRSL